MNEKNIIKENFSAMGEWWLPTHPEQKNVGEISVGTNNDIRLKTYHDFSDDDDFILMGITTESKGVVEVLRGKLRNGSEIMLFNCIVCGGGLIRADIMLYSRALPPFRSMDDFHFSSMKIYYDQLANWTPRALGLTISDDDNRTFKLNARQMYEYQVNDFKLKLNFSWLFENTTSNMTTKEFVQFAFENSKSYEETQKLSMIFADFLLLCLDTDIRLNSSFLEVEHGDKKYNIQIISRQRANRNSRQPKKFHVLEFGDLITDFEKCINNWYALNLDEGTRDAINIYTESIDSNTVIEITFLVLIQACEGSLKRIESEENKKSTLVGLLNNLFSKVAPYLPSFMETETNNHLVKKINRTRMYWIHNSGKIKKEDIFHRELYEINLLLSYALRVYLLQQIGVEHATIENALSVENVIGKFAIDEIKALYDNLKKENENGQ